jgi:hypothetical protein
MSKEDIRIEPMTIGGTQERSRGRLQRSARLRARIEKFETARPSHGPKSLSRALKFRRSHRSHFRIHTNLFHQAFGQQWATNCPTNQDPRGPQLPLVEEVPWD